MVSASPVFRANFLSTPAANIKVGLIDFAQTDIPEYTGLYAVVLDNVLSPEECAQLIHGAEASTSTGWERAKINAGGGRQVLLTDQRNCGRIIWDSQDVASKIWSRIEHVPEVQQIMRLENVPRILGNGPNKRGEVWKLTRPNERMRFLKYEGGEYFRPHCDGSYETPSRKERTYFTVHLYLTNSGEDQLTGGATLFHSMDMQRMVKVSPEAGRILLFQHRDLLHSGDDVQAGVKYTMRTDLLYALERSKSEEKSYMEVLEETAG